MRESKCCSVIGFFVTYDRLDFATVLKVLAIPSLNVRLVTNPKVPTLTHDLPECLVSNTHQKKIPQMFRTDMYSRLSSRLLNTLHGTMPESSEAPKNRNPNVPSSVIAESPGLCRFLLLPLELRNPIYAYLLSTKYTREDKIERTSASNMSRHS